MRTSLLATTIFLALFGGVSAQGTKPPDAYFVLVPNAETLSSQIVGLEVYNNNQAVARVEDIAIGKDGHIEAFILSVGDYLGLATHFVAVKPSALKIERSKGGDLGRVRMDVTRAQLLAAPEYRYAGTRKACLNILRF